MPGARPAGDARLAFRGAQWWSNFIWTRDCGELSPHRNVRRPYLKRGQDSRTSIRGADANQASNKPSHSTFDRNHHPAVTARPRRRGDRIKLAVSAFGPKRTSASAPHMSAFGG